jgi:hypothetical protein
MGEVKGTTAHSTGPSREPNEKIDKAAARQFGYEMAFDPRFSERRWGDVEPELRAIYQDWLKAHGYHGAGSEAWDEVKGAVREAWESVLDVEHTQVDPLTGRWEEVAPRYRRLWEEQQLTGVTWVEVEPGYRYAAEMRLDPRYQGRPWADVAPFLEAGLPGWAASHGYQVREGESLWDRLRGSIRHAWERVKHPSG